MSSENIDATVYTCDNPGCRKQFVRVENDLPPHGYFLDVGHQL